MNRAELEETRIAQLTPTGRGAIAVVLVTGRNALGVVAANFIAAGGMPLIDIPAGRLVYGTWGDDGSEDVVVYRRHDANYLGSHQIEIQCHGGTAACQAILARLEQLGCRRVDWREVSSPDAAASTVHDAQVALASATTLRAARVLLDQWHGALDRAARTVLVHLESDNPVCARELLDELLSRGDLGRHLTTPWRVALSGPPNVGKSSLINALVGHQRAIVADTPGTTRDVVTADSAVDGWPVRFCDTAGLRSTEDLVEQLGVRQTESVMASADLVIQVRDARQAPPRWSGESEQRIVHVANKADLVEVPQLATGELATSAIAGRGITELLAAISSALVPSPPAHGTAVPFTTPQIELLSEVRACVDVGDVAGARDALLPLLSGQHDASC